MGPAVQLGVKVIYKPWCLLPERQAMRVLEKECPLAVESGNSMTFKQAALPGDLQTDCFGNQAS